MDLVRTRRRVAVTLAAVALFGPAGGCAFAAELPENLALKKDVEASGVEVSDGRFTAGLANDGIVSADSRWSAAKTDEQWLEIDLGSVQTVSEFIVRFHAEPVDWELLVSVDGKDWKQVHAVTNGKDGGVEEDVRVSIDPQQARYVKYVQHKMWTHAGNGKNYSTSIYELEAYERLPVASFDSEEMQLTARDTRFLNSCIDGDIPEGAKVSYEVQGSAVKLSEGDRLDVVGKGEATVKLLIDGEVQDTLAVTVADPTHEADYDVMMDRWLARVTGGEAVDLSDADIAAYVAKINDEGKQLWAELNKSEDRDYLWEKLPSDTTSADYTTQFTKIKKLALAFRVKGSELYENGDLLNDIVDAVNFMVKNKKYNGSYTTGNWWDWQIGCTHQLCDILMIVSDYTDYKNIEPAVKAIEGYAKEPSKRFNGVTETGANRTDTGLAVLGSAIVAKNDKRMQMIPDQVPDVMKLVTSGDGLYADGSVVQHTKVAYTGAYGNELIKGIGRINSIIAGTKWDITDARITNVYETVLNGYIPLMHQGQQMASVNGRSISRAPGLNPFTTEFESGSETISNILLVIQFAPEPYKSAFESAVKGWLQDSAAWKSEFDYFGHARDFDALLQAKALLADTTVDASFWTGMKVYGSMDRVVQATEGYQAALAMYSKRIYNFEAGVGAGIENARGWHTGDGMLYIYNDDLKQFGEGFWPTVDPYRLPGTTVDTRDLSGIDLKNLHNKVSPQSWVGGATDGENGAVGMAYNANGIGGMNVTAKKSWFFLPGQVVALGSDINGSTDATIETTVENRMITSDDNAITVNGEAFDAGNHAESMELENGSYVHFAGTGEGNDLGYYFLEGGDVDIERETRTGSYADINGVFPSDTVYTKQYFKMGVNHGKEVEDGSYAYVILPAANEEATAAYAAAPGVEVLSNTEQVQAVRDAENGIFAMNVWPEETVEVAGLSVNDSASVYAQNKDGKLTIALSNPKQNNREITLKLGFAYGDVLEMDEGVTRNEDGSFTFDTTDKRGSSQMIVLEVGNKAELSELVESAQALREDDYTAETWDTLEAALTNAQKVLDEFAPSQDAIDTAADELQDALDNLKEVPTDPENPDDKPVDPDRPGAGDDGKPEKPGKPGKPGEGTGTGSNKPGSGSELPQTGDPSLFAAVAAAAGSAMAGIGATVKRRKR